MDISSKKFEKYINVSIMQGLEVQFTCYVGWDEWQ